MNNLHKVILSYSAHAAAAVAIAAESTGHVSWKTSVAAIGWAALTHLFKWTGTGPSAGPLRPSPANFASSSESPDYWNSRFPEHPLETPVTPVYPRLAV